MARKRSGGGNRKLVVTLTVVVLSFVLALMQKLTGEFVTIATASVAAFSAANAYEWSRKGGNDGQAG